MKTHKIEKEKAALCRLYKAADQRKKEPIISVEEQATRIETANKVGTLLSDLHKLVLEVETM